MKCPLMSQNVKVGKEITTLGLVDCLKKECAWWDLKNKCCSVCHITSMGEVLNYWLKEIRDKIPPYIPPH